MPCLNEERTLPNCIEAARRGIEAAGIAGEVIVVDNGSTDRSVAVAEAAGARVVRCDRRGYGNALRAGFAAAQGRFILMGDADVSYDFAELPRFWKEIEAGHDLVMGSRLRGRIEPGAMPWLHRYVGNPVLSGILRLLFRVPVSDAHCGMRAFTKEAVARMDLRTGGMELASEIVIKAGAAGLRIGEIPITLHKDARGRPPHLRSFRDGWRHLRYMLMMAPNWLFFLPGLLSLGTGGLLIGALLPGPLRIGAVTFDVHTMLLGMALALLGVYLLLLGCFVKAFSYTERLGADERRRVRLGAAAGEARARPARGRGAGRRRARGRPLVPRGVDRAGGGPPRRGRDAAARDPLHHAARGGAAGVLRGLLPEHARHQPRRLRRGLHGKTTDGSPGTSRPDSPQAGRDQHEVAGHPERPDRADFDAPPGTERPLGDRRRARASPRGAGGSRAPTCRGRCAAGPPGATRAAASGASGSLVWNSSQCHRFGHVTKRPRRATLAHSRRKACCCSADPRARSPPTSSPSRGTRRGPGSAGPAAGGRIRTPGSEAARCETSSGE